MNELYFGEAQRERLAPLLDSGEKETIKIEKKKPISKKRGRKRVII